MCIHGGLFVCFRKECSAQLLAYASRRLLSMPIVVVQSCFLPLIFFFLFPSASFCYRQQNWEDLYIQHSCCARGPRRGKPTRIKLFRLWRSLFVVVAHNNSQRNKTFPDLVRVTEGGAKSFFLFVTLGGVAERRAKNINLHGWEWLAYRDNSPSSPPSPLVPKQNDVILSLKLKLTELFPTTRNVPPSPNDISSSSITPCIYIDNQIDVHPHHISLLVYAPECAREAARHSSPMVPQ